jgi:hypothetical protein
MKVKHFSGTQEVMYPRPLRNNEFAARFPGVTARKYDGYSMMVGYLPDATKDGSELPITRTIFYKKNPSLHKCDARCQHAKGRNCECSCGGQFHGYAG